MTTIEILAFALLTAFLTFAVWYIGYTDGKQVMSQIVRDQREYIKTLKIEILRLDTAINHACLKLSSAYDNYDDWKGLITADDWKKYLMPEEDPDSD